MTSRLVDRLADLGVAAIEFLIGLNIHIRVHLGQMLLYDFPVAACLGVNLLNLVGSAGLRDSLEMYVGELIAGGLLMSELAATRVVSRSHRLWIASMWLRLQLGYAEGTIRLLEALIRTTRGRAARTRTLEESCAVLPRPWPYSVLLPDIDLTPPVPVRVRHWAVYGQRAVRCGVFTDQLVQDITRDLTRLIHQFAAEWIHPGSGALLRWLE